MPWSRARSRRALVRISMVECLLTLSAVAWAGEKTECTLPDCDEARQFFRKFQQAVNSDSRQDVARMVRYPLRSYRNGKATVFRTRTELLGGYDKVFTAGVRCALESAVPADVWGNWRGFTIGAGTIWWDRIIPSSAAIAKSPDLAKFFFAVFSVNHGPEVEKDCATKPTPQPR